HRVLDLLRRVLEEVVRLAGHRPEATHLPVDPLQNAVFPGRVARQEFPRLVREVLQDRAGLEERQFSAVPVTIHDGRHLVVRAYLKEFGFELITLIDVHRDDAVWQPGFLEHDGDLFAVARGPEVEVDQGEFSARVAIVRLAGSIFTRGVAITTGSATTCRNRRNGYPTFVQNRRS